MWQIFKNGQAMGEILQKYKDLVVQYKTFGYDLLNIKQDLQFYLSALPIIFLAGAFVHLYFFRKAHVKIAQLQGEKEAMNKQIIFLRGLVQKQLSGKSEIQEKNRIQMGQVQQIIKQLNDEKTQQQLMSRQQLRRREQLKSRQQKKDLGDKNKQGMIKGKHEIDQVFQEQRIKQNEE